MATAPLAQAAPTFLYLDSPIGRGPVLRSYRKRAFRAWLASALIGLLPSLLQMSPPWRAFGLGLWMPGGGFLYTASPHWLVLSLLLYVLSLALWLIVGGFIFPVIVWMAAAALAALDAHGTLWPWAQIATPLLALATVAHSLRKEGIARSAAVPRAAELKRVVEAVEWRQPAQTAPVGEPLCDRGLAAMRFALDMALQPIEEFANFETIDQIREAAWRYQLVTINYGLGILQASRMPAFRGYLYEAQRRSILKMCDRRVWHYWRIENFIGNLRLGADPIQRDNIMYSGWWALALGTFERATGDHQFSQPGALTLRESPSKSFVYDCPRIMATLADNFDRDPLCLFACEPNWVFMICNLYGFTGMLVHDREHGTRWGLDRQSKFNRLLEQEFRTAEGRAVLMASRRSGFIGALSGPRAFLTGIQLINMTSPRIAQAHWALFHHALEEKYKGDLSAWQLPGMAGLDMGNYRLTRVMPWAELMKGAREMGDEAMFDFALRRYDAEGADIRDGVLHGAGSRLAQLSAHMGAFATTGAWYRLANGEVPAAITTGPILDDAPYPEVLVAGANNDGAKLDLVLCAGRKPGLRDLKLARLQAGRRYCVTNSESPEERFVTADQHGNATITTPVGSRTHVEVEPVR